MAKEQYSRARAEGTNSYERSALYWINLRTTAAQKELSSEAARGMLFMCTVNTGHMEGIQL